MAVLADASVEIIADTSRFDATLREDLERAGATADRSARSIGNRIGRSIGTGLANVRDVFDRSLSRPLSALASTASRAGRAFSSAFEPVSRSIGAVRTELDWVRQATSGAYTRVQAFGGALRSAGNAASTAFTAARDNASLFVRGMRNVGAQASAANSAFYNLGTRARSAFDTARSGLSNLASRLDYAVDGAGLLNNAFTRMTALAGGVAAAAGIAELGSQILGVANSTQTARASMVSLYEAAGGGAAEVNQLMDEMQDRFRHLDMQVMQEGATTLAYMGLQGKEAVDVLEALDAATTAAGTGTTGLQRALDAMTKGVNAGKFQMGELNQISNAGIPIYDALADALGVSIPEAQKMASAGMIDLEDVLKGISGEFGTWFPALQEGAEDVGNTFASSWDSVRNTFVNGVANELVPILDRLAPKMADLADLLNAAFDELPGVIERAVRAGRETGVFDAIADVFIGIRDVAVGLAPIIQGIATAFGAFAGASATVFDLGSALQSLGGFLQENRELVVAVGGAIGGYVVALRLYRTYTLLATAASHLLSGGVRGIGVAIRGVPLIGWALAAVGALIALYQTSDRFREIVNTAFSVVRDAVAAAWEYIEPAWDAMVAALSELWDAVSGWEGWQTAWDAIQAAVSTAWDVISGIWDAITSRWGELTDSVDGDFWSDTWDSFASAVSTAWDIVSPIFDQIGEALRFLGDLVTGEADLSDVGDLLVSAFENLQGIGSAIADAIIGQLEQLPDRLRAIGSLIGDFVVEQLQELPARVNEALSSLGAAIIDWFTELPGRVRDAMSTAQDIMAWLQDAGSRAGEWLSGVGEQILEWFQGLPQFIRDNIDAAAILEWLRELPGRISEFMVEYGPTILRGFGIAMAVVVAGIPALFLSLLAAIQVVLTTIATELVTWAAQAFGRMMLRAAQAVQQGIATVVVWFQGLPGRAIAAIQGFGPMLASWGRGAFSQLRGVFSSAMSSFSSWWSGRWNSLVASARGVWDGFVGWARGAAARLRDTVMGPVDQLKTRLVSAFRTARDNIGTVWNGLKGKVAGPINWVIGTGYGGIKSVWDKVVGKFGGSKLPSAPPKIRYAAGGVFPGYTPGRDIHRVPTAAFSGGESVLRPEVTRAWGAGTTHMLNKLARSGGVRAVRKALSMLFAGHNPFTGRSVPVPSGSAGSAPAFAKGGVIGGAAGRAWDWLNSKSEEFSDGMMDFLDDPAGIFKKLARAAVDFDSIPGSSKDWAKLLARIPRKIIDELAKKAEKLFSFDGDWMNLGGSVGGRLGAALAFAKAQAGKPYIWGGVGPRGYDCCIVPGVRIYGPNGAKKIEDMRPGDQVYSYVDGQLQPHTVNAVWQSEYQEVFAVRTRNRKVTASANHPFMRLARSNAKATHREEAEWDGPISMPRGSRGTFVCTVSTCTTMARSRGMCGTHLDRWRKHGDPRVRQTTGNTYEVQWARTDELQRGDLLVQPRKMPSGGQEAPLLPGGVPVDADLAWLVGAMVGDGTVTDRGVRLALYGEDREKATRVFKDRFGGNPSHGQSYGIACSNTAARDVFNSIGMRTPGPKKRVPEVVWGWSEELQQAFLDGYCDADGHRPADTAKHGERTYHSASEELIEDVRALHMSMGHAVSNVSVTKRTKPIVIKGKTVKNALPQYGITVWGNSGRGEAALRSQPALREWLESGDFTVTKVLEVTPEGKQETWDMEIDQSHNFVADGVVVHNSGFISAVHNVILGKRPYSRRYTTHPFTGASYGGFRRNFPSPFTIGVTHANVGHMAGTLLKTNIESRGSAGVVVGSRARGTTNPLFTHRYGMLGAGSKRRTKMEGEGILYDRGGWLLPGLSLVANQTRRPESVRTYAQEANVSRLVRLVEAQQSAAPPAALVEPGRESELARVLERAGVGVGGTTVNAPVTVNTYAADPETVAYKVSARIARLAGV